jgi:hypothetical protein
VTESRRSARRTRCSRRGRSVERRGDLRRRRDVRRNDRDVPCGCVACAGTECRVAAGVCDVAETCDGTTAMCPGGRLARAGDRVPSVRRSVRRRRRRATERPRCVLRTRCSRRGRSAERPRERATSPRPATERRRCALRTRCSRRGRSAERPRERATSPRPATASLPPVPPTERCRTAWTATTPTRAPLRIAVWTELASVSANALRPPGLRLPQGCAGQGTARRNALSRLHAA